MTTNTQESNSDSYENCYNDGLAKMPCGCKSNLAVKDDTCDAFQYYNEDGWTCDICFHDYECHMKNQAESQERV